jgi:hypothetical protein
MATETCGSCSREIVKTPDGWSDGVRANPTLCVAAPELAHTPVTAVVS